jgi:hypothetical protein
MDAGDVEAAGANAGGMLRKAIERLPDVLALQLAPMTDESAIRNLLADEAPARAPVKRRKNRSHFSSREIAHSAVMCPAPC